MKTSFSRFARTATVTGCAIAAVSLMSTPRASAAVVASDVANNYTLYGGFSGANDGTGFGPWAVTSSDGTGGNFIAKSFNDDTAPAGQVFDVYENGTGTLNSGITTAVRPFATPLVVGGTFSFEDTLHYAAAQPAGSALPSPSSLGFSLLDSGGNTLLTLAVGGGTAGYALTDKNNSGVVQTGLYYNYQSVDTFTYTALDTLGNYSLTVTGASLAGGSYTLTGQTLAGASLPTSFDLFNNDGGGGSDIEFDALNITAPDAIPEPASLGLLGIAAVGLIKRKAR